MAAYLDSNENYIAKKREEDLRVNTFKFDSVFESKRFTTYDIERIRNAKYIQLSLKNFSRVKECLNVIKENNIDMTSKLITVEVTNEGYLSKEACENLVEVREKVRELGADLQIKDGALWSVEDVLNANLQIDNVINQINEARVPQEGNRPLTEREKFLWAYSFVANRKYVLNKNDFDMGRTITSIFEKGDCVCVGFATLLKELCNRLGIECYINSCEVTEKDTGKTFGHARNVVILEGVPYSCDACFDCLNPEKGRLKSYVNCLVPCMDTFKNTTLEITHNSAPYSGNMVEDLEVLKQMLSEIKTKENLSSREYSEYKRGVFEKYLPVVPKYERPVSTSMFSLFTSNQNCKEEAVYYVEHMIKLLENKINVTPVSLEEFEQDLINIHRANGYAEEECKTKAAQIIEWNVNYAGEKYEETAENCFITEYCRKVTV